MRLRTRPLSVALAVPVLALALAACSDDEPDASPSEHTSTAPSDDASSSAPTPSPSEPASSSAPAAALPAACDLITEGDVAKMMGLTPGPGESDTGDDDDAGVAWRTSECSFEAQGQVEVTVKVTGPADVTKGAFGCPQPDDRDGNVEPADDVAGASKGWWKTNSAPPLEATLRACSATANVDVDLDYDTNDYEGDPRQQAGDLAAFVLANLQG